MDFTKTLSAIESSLTRIYGVMNKIDAVKTSMGDFADKLDAGLSQVASNAQQRSGRSGTRNSVMPDSLGNVPEAPGAAASGTTSGTSGPSSGGGGSGGTGSGGGAPSGGAAAAARTPTGRAAAFGAAAASFAWNITPGADDVLSLAGGIFPTTYGATGNTDRMDISRRVMSAVGSGASSTLNPSQAAAMASVRGFGFDDSDSLDKLLRTSGSMYKVTGMSNVASMSGLTSMYQGTSGINDKLLSLGISTVGGDGSLRDIGDIVYSLLQRSNISNMTEEEFNKSLAMGYIGQTFGYVFGDSPELYAQAVAMARTQVKAGTAENGMGAKRLRGGDGSFESAARTYGDLENSPGDIMGKVYSSQAGALVEASEGGLEGVKAGATLQSAMYDLEAAIIRNTHVIGDFLMALKTGFQSTTAGLGRSKGGDVPGNSTSTHDSIPAVLARGEYVINARAAQLIGREHLDKMNSLGHEFGAGFASPAPVFLSTGGQPDWTHPFPHADVGISSGYLDPDRNNHAAIDLNIPGQTADEGKSVLSAASGTVTDVTYNSGSGGIVRIKHSNGYTTNYHHLARNSIPVRVGQSVSAGQTIGYIGRHGSGGKEGTGTNSTGAHLHFEIMHNGKHVDPTGIIRGASIMPVSGEQPPGDTATTLPQDVPPELLQVMKNSLANSVNKNQISVKGHRAEAFSMLQAYSLDSIRGSEGRVDASSGMQRVPKAGTSETLGRSSSGGLSEISDLVSGISPTNVLGSLMAMTSPGLLVGSLLGGAAKSGLDALGDAAGGIWNSVTGTVGGWLSQLFGGGSSQESSSPVGNRPKGALSDKELIGLLQRAGFKGEQLRQAWAIVMRESNGRPGAHNPDRSTGDNSYGLFQINMLGGLGPERVEKFGKYGLEEYDDLFDPWVNAQIAAHMSQKGKNWSAWKGGPGEAPTDSRYLQFYRDFPSVARAAGVNSYSEGTPYVSKDEVAKIHQGELVMPAQQAQAFREALQEVLSGARNDPREVNITLNIERASDEEAERFARRVMTIMKNGDRIERLSTL